MGGVAVVNVAYPGQKLGQPGTISSVAERGYGVSKGFAQELLSEAIFVRQRRIEL